MAGRGFRASTRFDRFAQASSDADIGQVMQIADEGDAANFVDGSGRVDRGIKPELLHFVECVRENRQPINDGESAKLAVAVCLAAQESIRRRETVDLSEYLVIGALPGLLKFAVNCDFAPSFVVSIVVINCN